MLFLLHALIPCLAAYALISCFAAYMLPSSCLAAYILHLFLYCCPTSFNIGNVYTPFFIESVDCICRDGTNMPIILNK